MPAKSKKQLKFMQAVAHNKDFAKKVGVPQSVGKEFTKMKKKYSGGGSTKGYFDENGHWVETKTNPEIEAADKAKDIAQERYFKDEEPKRTRNVKPAPKSGNPASVLKKKIGGTVKKHRGDGCAVRGKTKGRFV